MRLAPLVAVLLLACSSASTTTPDPASEVGDDASDEASDAVSEDTLADTLFDVPFDAAACPSPVPADPLRADRTACKFAKGSQATATLGVDDAFRKAIPITHLIVVVQENRAFDHYFGTLAKEGQPLAEGPPATWVNPDDKSVDVKPFHAASTCFTADPPHQWDPMHAMWNSGKMDGFVKNASNTTTNGHYVMGHYDKTDLPFYTWLASTWALADHHFPSVLSGTWANRLFLYAGTSDGIRNTGERKMTGIPTLFDALTKAKVSWGAYSSGGPRQDCLGWTKTTKGFATFTTFMTQLGDGTLPEVTFVDPGSAEDEHPPNDVQKGEAWNRRIYEAAIKSPLWPKLAVIFTYDEAGGTADHMPPPAACPPSADQPTFNRLGVRVPLMLVSPWARPKYVSKRVHEHTSITRLIELIHGIPALTDRDANSDALLDMFDFSCPLMLKAPTSPAAGTAGCK